jgi:hypothetical protein
VQRDVVLRWIEQLGRLIARLLGTADPRDLTAAREEVEAATSRLLAGLVLVVPRLAPSAAADLLHDPDRLFAYAQLLALESAIAGAEDDRVEARRLRDRALAFGEEAVLRARDPMPAWERWLEEARARPTP